MQHANTLVRSTQSKEVLSGSMCFTYLNSETKNVGTADGLVTHLENYGYMYSRNLNSVKAWAQALELTHPRDSIVRTVLGVVLAQVD